MWLGKWYVSRTMLLIAAGGVLTVVGLAFLMLTLLSSSAPTGPATPPIAQETPAAPASGTPVTVPAASSAASPAPSDGPSTAASTPASTPATAAPTPSQVASSAAPSGTTGVITTTTGQGTTGTTGAGGYTPQPGEITPPVPPAFSGTDTPQALTAKAGMKMLFDEPSLLDGSRTPVDALRLLSVAAQGLLPATAALPAQIRPSSVRTTLMAWSGGQTPGGPDEGSGLTLTLNFASGQCRVSFVSANQDGTLDKFDTQPFPTVSEAVKAVTCGAPAN